MPKLTFGYAGLDLHDTEQLPGADGWVVNDRGVSFADVDGDGAADLLRLEMGNHEWRKSRGNEFAGARPITGASDVDLDASALIDLDGDARPELVRIVDDTWRAYKLVGESWQSLGEWPGTAGLPIHDGAAALADVNGDGRTDVIRGRTGGIAVNFNGPTGMGPTVSLPRISPNDVQVEPGADGVRFVDMNGDGVVDVAWMTDSWIKIFLGRGDGTFVPFDRVSYPWGTAALDPVAVQLADLNRDGLIDLVRIVDGQAQWYPGLASLHFTSVPRLLHRPDGVGADAVVTITDANGNGSQDVVWSDTSGIWIQDLAGATSAGMLETIDNGLGEIVRIAYQSSAALAIAAELRGEPWQVKLPVAVPVPTRSETDLGAGFPARVVEHSVRDGFWDGSERRFGGFLQGLTRTLAADPSQTLEVETRFHQGLGDDRELRGKNWFSKRSNAAGLVFDVVQQTLEADPVAGLPDTPLARKAALRAVSSFVYEGGTVPIETRVENFFDGEVRVTEEHHLGVPTVAGDEKIIRRVYGLPDAVHVQDVVCQETVLEGDGRTVVSDLRRFYGDAAPQPLPFLTVGKGWVRSVQSWLHPGAPDRWVEQSSANYDAVGNPIATGDSGVIRDIGYEPLRLFPITESIRESSPLLLWRATWDATLGRIATVTDPNHDVTTVSYDPLGRPSGIAVNSPCPHMRYAYDWSAPLPTTTTFLFDGTAADLPSQCMSGPLWRTTVGVADGAGEGLYKATTFGAQFIISDWKERDERGQVVRVAESFYAPNAAPTAPVSGTRIQTLAYDALGRLILQTLPNGATKSNVYRPLGRTVTSTDLGPVSYTFDGLERVMHTERDPGTSVVETVDATFDAADRITAMSLQGGQAIHAFSYDTLGRLIHASDPDIGERTLVYDDRNLLRQHTNGEGQVVVFDYDVANRLTRRGETATPSPATDYSYTYDDPNVASGTECHVASRLASVREPMGDLLTDDAQSYGDVHFCYDMLGRQVGMNRTLRAPGAPVTSGGQTETLGLSGLVFTEAFDDGFSTTFHYDPAGRVDSVSSADGPLWGADEIDATGRVIREHYGNGATQAYVYGPLGLTSHIKVAEPGGATLYEVSVDRNAYGAPTIVTDPNQGAGGRLDHNATFSYDGAGRLTLSTLGSADRQFRFSFQYDALQNMIFRGVTAPPDVGDIGVLTGTYRYGERGYGPRQLTSVVPGGGP
jgi:YD repeat-containing protein